MDKSIRSILENLKEEFHSGKESKWGDYTEIFVNPNMDEIRESLRERGTVTLRFLAVKRERKLYIWNPELIHKDAADEVGISFNEMKENNLAGVALFENNQLYFGQSNVASIDKYRRRELAEEVLNGDYDWLEDFYFNLNPMKEDCENFLESGSFNMGQVSL